ncbi:MAG TPA: toll/interleukin-1 receptor domain-containing protein [Ktedonobacteraceae bacterium]|nr:toll/interleukin-1 receptor domain-containing protein [Ktedonobacteraceae bacterium]
MHPYEEIDLHGVDFHGFSLRGINFGSVDLEKADLSGIDLTWSNLNRANLHRANLREVNLTLSSLIEANLTETCLCSAELTLANLRSAILLNGDLRNTKLDRANLINATLRGADLTAVQIGNTAFDNVDLSEVKGLDTIYHFGPSSIGIDTIYRSKGNVSDIFLKGAGVPEPFITNMRSLVTSMSPFEFYSSFISFSRHDEDFAKRLYTDLQAHGVRCWFAPDDMKIGDKIRPRIDEAIHLQDKLLLILSKHSVSSDWVEHEVETALAREHKEKRTILFPIRLDNAILEQEYIGWPALVQHERHIGDFTGWKDHNQYQATFKRLLRDLKQADE